MIPPVLVPVNHLDRAKGRLAELLTLRQRAELAMVTLATVLDAVREAGGGATVLSADSRVRETVASPHAARDENPESVGLNAQLTIARNAMAGADLLILHGDLPLVTAHDIAAIVAAAPYAPSITIVQSGDGGTNAMLLRPPDVIDLHYGRGSAALHRHAAEEAAVAISDVALPGVALDLDTPADIDRLLSTDKGRTSAAGKLLRSWGFDARGRSD